MAKNDINSITLTGRIASDPDFKAGSKDKSSVCKFTLANNTLFSDEANWIQITAFKNNAEFISKYLKKGAAIAIEGELSAHTFTDSEGKKRVNPTVIVKNIISMYNSNSNTGKASPSANAEEEIGEEIDDDDDLPF